VTSDARPRVLYLVYWGAAEPLGQSIVLPPVTRIALMGATVTLVTFEKPADLARRSEIERISAILTRHAVRWLPLRYHKRPKGPAKLFDVLHGVGAGLRLALRLRPDIVHARTFVGGIMGVLVAPLVGAKLVYHAEGFYPDEQVDGGFWVDGSLLHRAARLVERVLYARADGIVVLSERAKAVVERLPTVQQRTTPVIVVPSCVDLKLFSTVERLQWHAGRRLRLVYVGSTGGRYLFQRVAEFAAVAHRRLGRVSLRVLTRTERSSVEAVLRDSGLPRNTWSVGSVPHSGVPEALARQDVGMFLFTRGISEHGCSPTKVGEYWAMGLPVVITPNVSDTEDIIRRERVGVLLSGFSDEAYARALDELLALLEDSDLPKRCRAAAEEHYGLGPACERLQALYAPLVGDRSNEHDRRAPLSAEIQRPDGSGPDRQTRSSR
jgi:glycosyltransferase involved in cell wall biosynthesis